MESKAGEKGVRRVLGMYNIGSGGKRERCGLEDSTVFGKVCKQSR